MARGTVSSRGVSRARKKSPPPDRRLRPPKLTLTAGACDTRFHGFGLCGGARTGPLPNSWEPMPNDAALPDMMLEGASDEAARHRIFVDNPIERWGFPPVPG